MLLFIEAKPPELSPLIQVILQVNVTETPPKVITWQDNPNSCTDNQWIALESPFYCIEPPKPTKSAVTAKVSSQPIKSEPQTGSVGLNGYVLKSCTGWVATHRYVPNGWGNATNWKNAASKAGWTVSSTPVVDSIGWVYGHVVLVTAINNDGTIEISERNYDYKGSIRTKTVPSSKYTYLY